MQNKVNMRALLILVQNRAYDLATDGMTTSAGNRELCYSWAGFLFVVSAF